MSEFFDESTHIVAEPRKQWPYFDIPGCLRMLSWSVDECYGRIYPKYITKDGLARHAVVQVALYTCPPFREITPSPHIWISETEGYIEGYIIAKRVRTSFTLVRSEADLVWETPAWPGPRAARRL
jgi:hypothetical protein